MTRTGCPRVAVCRANNAVKVVLPTPPLPLSAIFMILNYQKSFTTEDTEITEKRNYFVASVCSVVDLFFANSTRRSHSMPPRWARISRWW